MRSYAHGSDTREYKIFGDVQLLLVDSAGRALLGLRHNTGLLDGHYNLPAGHVEEGESVIDAAIREAQEELGITIEPEDLEFAHVMHSPLSGGRASFFFRVRQWKGIPVNGEPHKCKKLQWFALDQLPDNIVSFCRSALEHIQSDTPFSLCGWETQPDTQHGTEHPAARKLRTGTRSGSGKLTAVRRAA
jgi:8-oxo-dGTP diphosphatase